MSDTYKIVRGYFDRRYSKRTIATGLTLDEALKARIQEAIRQALSPRFLPNAIFQVAEIPRTLSGKKQELPIKKLMLGHPLEKVVNKEAMANPGCLDWYMQMAQRHVQASAGGDKQA